MDKSIPPAAAFLMEFIGSLEAPKGYDTVYNNQMKKMPKRLTSMTFDEVVAQGKWRTDTFGSSACGRYQFMRDTLDKANTLNDIKGQMKLTGSEKFTPDLQDRMCFHLLKRRGYDKFMAGKMSVNAFQNQLAMEWASFPVATAINGKKRGQSYYAGDGKNASLTTADKMEAVLRQALAMGSSSTPVVSKGQSVEEDRAKPSRPSVGGILASLWAKLSPTSAKPSLPVLATKGDPVVFNVQKQLKDRGYYLKGLLDGDIGHTRGSLTREAINSIRQDNGMGPGGIDDEFLQLLPTFGSRPIGKERGEADYNKAKAHAPELATPVGTLWKGGLASIVLGSAQATDLGSLLDRFKETGDKANDVLGSVQTGIGTVGAVIQFIVSHWQWFAIGFGIYLLLRAANFAATIVGNFRRGFF